MKKLFYPLSFLICAAGSAHSLPSSHGINETSHCVNKEVKGAGLPNISKVIGTAADIHKYMNTGYTFIAEYNDLAEAIAYVKLLALTGEDIIIHSTGSDDPPYCILVRKRPTI